MTPTQPSDPPAPIIDVKVLPVVATWLEIVKAFTDDEDLRHSHIPVVKAVIIRKIIVDVADPKSGDA